MSLDGHKPVDPMPIRRNPDYVYPLPAANLTINDLERIKDSLLQLDDTVSFETNSYAFDSIAELPHVPGPKNRFIVISGQPSGIRMTLGFRSRIFYYGNDPAARDRVIRIRDDLKQSARFAVGWTTRGLGLVLMIVILAVEDVIANLPEIRLDRGPRLVALVGLGAANVALFVANIVIPTPGRIRVDRKLDRIAFWDRVLGNLVKILVLTIAGVLAIAIAAYLGLR
jgi:hypothetical protein